MPQAQINNLKIEYEVLGKHGAPAVLLIMGAGGPLTIGRTLFVTDLLTPAFRLSATTAAIADFPPNSMSLAIKIPTLVIHGSDDPVIPVESGRETARSIPAAKLKIIEGMGHGTPPGVVPILLESIVSHCGNSPSCA